MEKKIRKIKPYTRKWEYFANELARSLVLIHPCKECGWPVQHGYCCGRCGSNNPLDKENI